LQKGETEEARSSYKKSLAIFRKVRDLGGEADTLYRLGVLALRTSDIDAALQYYTDSLNIRRLDIRNDRWGEGVILYSLGNVYQQIGDVNKALNHYIDGLEICKRVGNRRGEGTVLKALGDLALQTSGPADAERYLDQSSFSMNSTYKVRCYAGQFRFSHRQTGKSTRQGNPTMTVSEIRGKVKDERGRSLSSRVGRPGTPHW
jgi:tetratricopeptide (TPR) repeat protein